MSLWDMLCFAWLNSKWALVSTIKIVLDLRKYSQIFVIISY